MFVYELSGCLFESCYSHLNFRYGACFQQEFLDIQATIEFFTLKIVRDMIRSCYKDKKNGRIMLLSKCEVCDSKKSKFIKEQEPSGLLSSLGMKTPLSKVPLLGPSLF